MKKGTILAIIAIVILAIIAGVTGATLNINIEQDKYNASIEYSEETQPALVEDDKGEVVEEEAIPTVEEVDGGKFEDATTGVSVVEGEYGDLGWSEWYPTDTPQAFKNATLGKCIIANNIYGAQCVSLARVYWWSYANRDVSTCGTGMAKGMMNCADQNAGNDFEIYWKDSAWSIQAGDWLIFDGGQYGHVGMALGPVTNGYVALLAYIKPEPTPEPEPEPTPAPAPERSCERWSVKKGDTMGAIMKACEGKIEWGEAMNRYADSWVSEKTGLTVYYGWTHGTGYGLLAGDTIVKK